MHDNILKVYYLSLQEKYYYKFGICKLLAMKKSCSSSVDFQIDVENIVKDIDKEIEILRFMMMNEKIINPLDVKKLLKIFESNFYNRYVYFKNIIDHLGNREKILESNYESVDMDYLTYAKGFSYERVKTFFEEEKILSRENVEDVVNMAKLIPYEGYDYLYGVYDENKVILPTISDDESVSIAIHELVHVALLQKNGISEEIKLGEDLPIFYELLFQKINQFSKCKLHTTIYSLKLLDSYNKETFDEQIKKLDNIKRNKNQ